jgi:hypothetical protein
MTSKDQWMSKQKTTGKMKYKTLTTIPQKVETITRLDSGGS